MGKIIWFVKLCLKLNWDFVSKGEMMVFYIIGEVVLFCDINFVMLWIVEIVMDRWWLLVV